VARKIADKLPGSKKIINAFALRPPSHRRQAYSTMAPALKVDDNALEKLESRLLNLSGDVPLHDRFRALFTLKALANDQAVKIISKGKIFHNLDLCIVLYVSTGFKDNSALLKHELAYVLGQMGQLSAVPTLTAVLQNPHEDPMVRHEVSCYRLQLSQRS
jgi:deoxyhypusine monooxygenase